ncbi:hypothetical protein LJK87_15745 [Paenibacillus sp. P25]|nr:hypothetical protein LJK87_15745 [Paenibacillus sp. P25]
MMNISGLIRGLAPDVQAAEPKVLELKTGEVVRGVVLQTYPDQEALVNINGIQVRAKLETPLKQGESTMLQVQPGAAGGQVVLKPLGSQAAPITDGTMTEVLKTLGLEDNADNRQMIQMMHRAGIELSKENVQAFADLQSRMPAELKQADWMPSAVIAFQKGLPLTPETVASVRQAVQGRPLHETLRRLEAMAEQLTGEVELSPESRELLQSLRTLIGQIRSAAQAGAGAVASGAAAGGAAQAGAGTGASGAATGGAVQAGAGAGASGAAAGGAAQAGAGAVASGAMAGGAVQAGAGAGASGAMAGGAAQAGAGAGASGAMAGGAAQAGAGAVASGAMAGGAAQAGAGAGASGATAGGAVQAGAGAVASGAAAGGAVQAGAGAGASGAAAGGAAQAGAGAEASGASAGGAAQAGAGAGASGAATGGAVQAGTGAGASGAMAGGASQPGAGAVASGAAAGGAAQAGAGAVASGAAAGGAAQAGAGAVASGAMAGGAVQAGAGTGASGAMAGGAVQPGAGVSGAVAGRAAQAGAGAVASGAATGGAAQAGAGAAPQSDHWLSRLMKSLGVEHEHQAMKLLDAEAAPGSSLPTAEHKSAESLKSVLLQLSQADDLPSGMKEAAQQAVQQITGQQLLLNPGRDAVFSQITMFVPR